MYGPTVFEVRMRKVDLAVDCSMAIVFCAPKHKCLYTLLLNVNYDFCCRIKDRFRKLNARSSCHWFSSILRCAAVFRILIEFDIKFWTCKEAKNICSTFGDTKQSYASSRDSVTDPCGTLWAGSKNAIYLDTDRRPYLIPYSSMCDWSTPRVWPLFSSMTFPSPPTKPICRIGHLWTPL